MNLETEPWPEQQHHWPRTGRHILAQFDATSVIVYQAYKPSIGHFAAEHGRFGGEFKLSRMSWVKTNFLWMMFRSGWGTKTDQEVTLAVCLRREAFDSILAQAVPSTPGQVRERFATEDDWKAAVARSSVRLQWDPDHHPSGAPLERRAIQLGLRGDALRRYSEEWLLGIEDISGFVAEQRGKPLERLVTPRERVYPVDAATARTIGLAGDD